MKAIDSQPRIDYLDAVRAFALLLGIVFHASLSFMPSFIGWAVMDVSTGSVVPAFVLVSHSFRMALFFLIAGFFSRMTFHRKGAGAFLKSRAQRIALPFALGWFLLYPLVVSGWTIGAASMRGDADILAGLAQGFQTLQSLPAGLFTQTHLWFLYYLLLVTASTLLLRQLLRLAPFAGRAWLRVVDRALAVLAASPSSAVLLALPTAACLWFMSHWGMDTPDKSLVPRLPTFLVYNGCFLLGWLLHRRPSRLVELSRFTPTRLINLVGAAALTLYLSRFQSNPAFPYLEQARLAFVLSYGVLMWSLVFGAIGLFRTLCRKPSKTARYLADASYWLYLVHLPLVIWLQIAVAELPFHWSLKLVAVSAGAIGISLLLYDLLVRPTIIGQLLNGRRHPRALPLLRPNPRPAHSAKPA